MYDGRLVRLRAVEPADAESFYRWMNDREVTRFLAARYPFSRRMEDEWIAANARPSYAPGSYAIETLAEGRLVGACGFHEVDPENRRASLGISIGDKTVWDRGYGTDAVRTLCRLGFAQMNLHRIELWVYDGNDRAVRAYRKVGFVPEIRTRQAVWKNGGWLDDTMMAVLRHEFREDD